MGTIIKNAGPFRPFPRVEHPRELLCGFPRARGQEQEDKMTIPWVCWPLVHPVSRWKHVSPQAPSTSRLIVAANLSVVPPADAHE